MDEPHPTLLRTPAAPLRRAGRLCRGQRPDRSRYAFVPDSVASRTSAGSPSPRKGPVRHGSRAGRVVGRCLLLRGAAAGVGWTGEGASAPSPFSLRQLRADLACPPTHRRGVARCTTADGKSGRGRRPIKPSGCRGCGPGHATADLASIDKGMSSSRAGPIGSRSASARRPPRGSVSHEAVDIEDLLGVQ